MYLFLIVCGLVFKKNFSLDFFKFLDIYFMICEIFGIKFVLNNGFMVRVK